MLQIARSLVPGGLAAWIVWPKPEPMARLEDSFEIERPDRRPMAAQIRPLDEDDAREARWNRLRERGVEARHDFADERLRQWRA